MKEFYTMPPLLRYLLKNSPPAPLIKDLLFSMFTVEQCNTGGANQSTLIIAETPTEDKFVTKRFNLSDYYPESDEEIQASERSWRKRIFVFDDTGSGIILYSPTGNEKRTE